MSVKFIELDIINYSGDKDFQVLTEYISNRYYNIIVRRLDSFSKGWDENLDVLVCYLIYNNYTKIINIGSSDTNEKIILVETNFDIDITNKIEKLKNYELISIEEIKIINRLEFNNLFNTNIVTLPTNLYGIGYKNNIIYLYIEKYVEYYYNNIIKLIKTIINITNNIFKQFYFIICIWDGYLEYHYYSDRNIPKYFLKNELDNKDYIMIDNLNEYPVLHKNLYVLTMSSPLGFKNICDITDRYYFNMNLYNNFRSIHNNILFESKINKIIYAGSISHGFKYNYSKRRDIEINQRKYLKNIIKNKEYIYYPSWINKKNMIEYKYILEVDGSVSTWDAIAWKLNSGSVIIKSDSVWRQWFYDEFLPWIHYVPITDDFNDLDEKYIWCETHQEECEIIIRNCKQLFQKVYRFENVTKNIINVIYKSNLLIPNFLNNQRIFCICRNDTKKEINNFIINKQSINGFDMLYDVSKYLFSEDLIIYIDIDNIDISNYNLEYFINIYNSFNKKILVCSYDYLISKNNLDQNKKIDFIFIQNDELMNLLDKNININSFIENILS
jgi:hypothetical protein